MPYLTLLFGFILSFIIVGLFPNHIETIINISLIILAVMVIIGLISNVNSKPQQEEK